MVIKRLKYFVEKSFMNIVYIHLGINGQIY